MFEIITLGSGSAGNAALIRSQSTSFLVDAGLSAKQLGMRLQACGITVEELSGILLTHEHSDHTSALKVLLAKHDLPVYCNTMTGRALQEGGLACKNWRYFQTGADFSLGDFTVRAFSVPHDAVDPVGFRISSAGACLGVLTDLGHATRMVFDALRGVRAMLIETNYDVDMLQRDMRRPWSVKQRIQSRHGHLSNLAAANVLAELDAPLQHVILGHLSRDCNSPETALACVAQRLAADGRSVGLHCAGQDASSPAFSVAI